MTTVIAAIDLGPSSRRVLQHAAGFARLLSARVRILHVTPEPTEHMRRKVIEFCTARGPYEVDVSEEEVIVRGGHVSEAIYREAVREHTAMIVMGSRGHGRITRMVIGSTSAAVLRTAPAPVLLVPPVDLEIINIADRVTLTSGAVLAAIDLAEASDSALQLAGSLAHIAAQPLLLMTVASPGLDDHDAGAILRSRAHQLSNGHKPVALIVRRGDVAEQISRCAAAEGAGLVVMGIRKRARGSPGAIASAVLNTRRAFVLAVPAA